LENIAGMSIVSDVHELTIYTVGHSTRTLPEFINLMVAYKITLVIDVRAYPNSKHNPQFNKETFMNSLKENNIKYIHMPALGGLRRPHADSINIALENKSFRGYADYMQTKEYNENLLNLLVLAKENCTAIMCAEAVPWRCHRSLISDSLVARHIKVYHILNQQNFTTHELNPIAKIEGTKVTYPLFTKEKPQKTLADFGSST
jgi:uncharacterized protein (DUF488 family)